MIQNITAGDMVVDLDDIRKIPIPAIQFHDEYRRGYAEALIDVAAIARRAEPSVAAKDGLSGVSLDEALYALDLVINNMNVPGLSGQMAYAKEVLARAALTSPAVSQMGRAADMCEHVWPEADGQTDINGRCEMCGLTFQRYIHGDNFNELSAATTASASSDTQADFEAWARSHGGLPLDLAGDATRTDDGLALPTYKFGRTEIAWRAFANRRAKAPSREQDV
jgi:hypothetical protein